ncbi:hypothetical protein KKH39_04930 [Patescibacteria group bacterium]|nr:hypothetical protein [Patescibacteria group bacterium]
MPLEFQLLSLIELRQYVAQLNENSHPGFVFRILVQCLCQIKAGACWPQIGTTQVDMQTLMRVCHKNQVRRELQAILAKNEYTPLNFDDAEKLSCIMEEIQQCHINWNDLPVSENVLRQIINMAACGYEHCNQQKMA